jgi:hypothetical protein
MPSPRRRSAGTIERGCQCPRSPRSQPFVGWDVGTQGVHGCPMSDADQLRDRAARLFALARKARDNGLREYANELTQLASEAFDQAADKERRSVSDPKTPLQ